MHTDPATLLMCSVLFVHSLFFIIKNRRGTAVFLQLSYGYFLAVFFFAGFFSCVANTTNNNITAATNTAIPA